MNNKKWIILIDGYAVARVDAPTEECVRRWAVARFLSETGMAIVEDLNASP